MRAACRNHLVLWFLIACGLGASLPAQDVPKELDPITVQALDRVATQLEARRQQRANAVEAGQTARAATLDAEIRELSWQFAALTSRFDVKEFEEPTPRDSNLQAEVESLIEPLLQAVKKATATPREIAALQKQIEELTDRRTQAEAAQRAATRTYELLPADSPAKAEANREVHERWRRTIEDLRGEILILEARKRAKEQGQRSLLETTQDFLKSSGLNLLLCGLAFFAVLFGMRFLQNVVLNRRRQERAVSLRVFEVMFGALGLVLAIAATLVVPYVRNDWLLLAVGIVFLIGAGWVLVRMAPQFFEQIRLILNIGSVREGERLIVDGLPYRIDSLRFYSTLVNPDLQGGELRVPIQELVGKRSRVCNPGEPWFPSRVGDVVILADDVIGPVTVQTPELVVVEDYAAARTYTATAFLAEKPRNLSRGFGVMTKFGVDYRHQRDATGTIPQTLEAALRQQLGELVAEGQLLAVQVQFEAANSSSLDFEARADFTGEAAPRYRELRRALQRILVDACSRNGWNIPFPQLTVHKGG